MFDGQKWPRLVLEPAQEIDIGGVTVVTESNLSIAVYAYFSRLLGWNNFLAVDLALRALRVAAMRKAALVLCGDDLVSVARTIHRKALGADRPFVYCGLAGVELGGDVIVADKGMTGLRAARKGTLCLVNEKLPDDYLSVNRDFHLPDTKIMMAMCSRRPLVIPGVHSIEVPPLSNREGDLPRIIREYAADAARDLGVEIDEFPGEYVDWIAVNHAKTFEQIERATERLLALHVSSSAYAAAKLLGIRITKQGLYRWLKQYELPLSLGARVPVEHS